MVSVILEKEFTDIKSWGFNCFREIEGQLADPIMYQRIMSKYEEFKEKLRNASLIRYLEVDANYTIMEWELHNMLTLMTRMFSDAKRMCLYGEAEMFYKEKDTRVRELIKRFDSHCFEEEE